MHLTSVIFTLVGLFSLVLAADIGSLPYPVEVARFSASYDGRDGPLNGTVQEVIAQMKTLQPSFNPDSLEFVASSNETDLTSRDTEVQDGILCCPVAGQGWDWATTDNVNNGIGYLRKLKRNISIGPRSCGRISCSWSAAIYLCNDARSQQVLASSQCGDYASHIVNRCKQTVGAGAAFTCGQIFDTTQWNIIVRYDDC